MRTAVLGTTRDQEDLRAKPLPLWRTSMPIPFGSDAEIGLHAGPGSVGTGSLRGMSLLRDLYESGFSIWPFDPPGSPSVLEIYPRLFTGPVVKSDPAARRRFLEGCSLGPRHSELAEGSDDAFDAAASALAISAHTDELSQLERATSRIIALEGDIWIPRAFGT